MHLTIPLPPGYDSADVFTFHARDREAVAEQTGEGWIRKGVMVDGVPVLLAIRFEDGAALCGIAADGALGPAARAGVEDMLVNILALRIDPAAFVRAVRDDALLGPLARARPGLRIVQSATIFEALTWAIIGQQINLPFAIALRRTFILQAGRQHSSGIWCYPEARDVSRLDPEALTSRKFSRSKAETLLRLAALVDAGDVKLTREDDIAQASAALMAIKGIGPWTVNYALLRGYGYADCSLHGDVAIRAAFQQLLGEETKPDMARTEALLAAYRPHRTMAAAYLWSSLAP